MSQSSTPTGRPEKTMSSRLMTMKFMQRAAASSPITTSNEPNNGPLPKRRKISTVQSLHDQSSLPSTPTTDAQIYQAAVDAEDAKRAAAIERVAAQVGETKWVLSNADGAGKPNSVEKKLQFLTAGYSDIDEGIDTGGRRVFGRFKMKDEVGFNGSPAQQDDTADSDTGSISGVLDFSDEDNDTGTDSDDDNGGGTLARTRNPLGNTQITRAENNTPTARKKKKGIQKPNATNAETRRQKDTSLNGLKSISGGGGGRSSGGALVGIECHFCREKGHRKAECPKKARQE
ncbi:MAG: hypothetical protein Q9204_000584 [Flavoplaca sp. TL-2023a]